MKTSFSVLAGVLLLGSSSALAQPDRIATPINSSQTVVLKGSVSPLAKPENDRGPLDPATKLPHVTMMMKLSAVQQADLDKLLVDQQDPSSPDYHHWLTPEQYGARFGLSQADIRKITQWLASQGFAIVEVARGRNWIAFGGTVDRIQRAFHTQIHRFTVNGEEHFANTNDPSVPMALQGIAAAFQGLHNFVPRALSVKKSPNPFNSVNPYYTDGNGGNELAPDDIATIYNVAALYQAGIDGTGMKVAIIGRTDIHMTDIEQFRTGFGLSKNDPTDFLVPTCTDPGFTADEAEADLDLEWSGAVARNAAITFVKCDANNGGIITSLQYAINNSTAPVISMSYGECEANVNSATATSYQSMIQQANTQGQTVMVSSGDSGAAGCDPSGNTTASGGLGVNILSGPPEVTAVGGTEFDADVLNQSTYWSANNGANLGSALSYIGELAWDDSGAGTNLSGGQSLSSTGGGVSIYFPKPAWQTGPGTYDPNHRSQPDVSMPASPYHDGYIVCTNTGGATYQGSCANGIATAVASGGSVFGGTSVACPVFAGIVTLINQSQKNTPPAGLGNINPTLYALSQSMPTAFHDVPAGNYSANPTPTPSGNVVPCQTGATNCTANGTLGYLTGGNYDPVTGLGSVDAHALLTGWPSTSKTSTTTTLAITPANPVPVGTTVTFTATITPAPPDGETVTFKDTISNTTLGTATTTAGKAVATSSTIAAGSYTVVASYPGDITFAASASTGQPLTVGQGITTTTTTLTIAPGNSVPVGTTVTFTATITPAPPNGETVTFKDTISNTTLGTGTTTTGKAVFTSATLAKGSYNVVASYPGDANFSASVSAGQALSVGMTTTTTTLAIAPGGTVNAGTSVTFTATITPAPPNGETVTFTDTISNKTLGTANTASGVAAFTSTTIAAGSYTVVANYPGDASLGASVSAGQALTVQKATTTTTLAIAPGNSVTPGTSVTLTATIAPAPPNGETVTFMDTKSNTALGTATTAAGQAVFASTGIPSGSYTVVASYPGDSNFAASASTGQSLTVQKGTSTTTLTLSPGATVNAGASVTLTAIVAPAPPNGETVTFTDTKSNTTLGTATTSSGTAIFTSTGIPGGSYTVTANYPGDTTLASSVSTGQALNVQDFTIGPNNLSITVSAPGQTGTGTINLGLLGGLAAPSFSCSGLPSESTCSFAAASATSETITIATTAASSRASLFERSSILYATLFPGLFGVVILAADSKKRKLRILGLLAVLVVFMLVMSSCGTMGSTTTTTHHDPGTPIGQTTPTVTATASGITHTITINLNVQ